MEEGETPIHHTLASLTGRDVSAFCAQWYLNPMAMKKMLELRQQFKYFLE